MRKIVCVLTLSLFAANLNAQDFLGLNQSNYAGISSIYQNPANIANGRDKFDMNLVGFSGGFYNNYLSLDVRALETPWTGKNAFTPFNDPNFKDKYLQEHYDNNIKNAFLNTRIMGPSFMLNLDHKNAIGFAISERNYMNVDGVTPQFARLLYYGLKGSQVQSLLNSQMQDQNLSVQEMSWMEYGLTFAHVFTENSKHFFKGGITLNILQGIQSSYVYIKDFNYKFTTDSTAAFFNSNVNYGHSSNLSLAGVGANSGGITSQPGAKILDFSQSYPGMGFSLGMVYEYRPDFEKYEYDMDGEHKLWRKDLNKYKYKLGLTLSDVGYIRFKKGGISNDFNAETASLLNGLWNFKHVSPKSLGGLDSTLKSTFAQNASPASYTMYLPTVVSLQFDYNLNHNFYLNVTPTYAFQFKNSPTKVHDYSSIIVTPRWDHKWFGIFVPIQYHFLDGFRAGAAVRIGPLAFGTTNITPIFGGKYMSGADAYVMLKLFIPYSKPKDKDKDGISNKKDKCPTVPGVWEFAGCPDRDGDHVQDTEDKCPDQPGSKELHGCPDKDGDGIIDAEDACPDEKGLVEFKGCPDRDGDKIIDKDDECPDDAGLAEFMGCPDKDGDKVIDKLDLCPDVPGPVEYKGCPDQDGDTVLDKDDACPEIPGPVENKGCPWPDSDKDGVADREDDCPQTPGLKALKGCPAIKPEEQKIVEKAFANLEFATGTDVIRKTSFASLTDLAKVLKQHSGDWMLKLSGHTDNQGKPEKNLLLSEKRAKAVKKFLVLKGENAEKIMTEWFGQTQPIGSNDTPEGRQKNRRVEMKIIFK